MATTLTSNLKLRLDSNLTANARYNLLKIDALGAVFNLDNTNNAVIRSAAGIIFRPNDTTAGGSGSGGTVQFGSTDQPVASLSFHADSVSFGGAGGLGLEDQATGGTKKLNLLYDSTATGTVDTAADRSLTFDTEGGNRKLILAGDLSILGGSLSLTVPSSLSLSFPANSVGVLNNDGSGGLSWSAAGSGTVTSVDISATSPLASSGGPITTSGSFSLGFQNQNANWLLAGPTSGGAAAPVFQALVASDINQVVGYRAMSAIWTSGTTFTVTHNWGTQKIMVEVLDAAANYAEVIVDSEERPTINTVVLTSNEAPSSQWVVLLKEIP